MAGETVTVDVDDLWMDFIHAVQHGEAVEATRLRFAIETHVSAAARREGWDAALAAVREGWEEALGTMSDEAKAPGETTGFERGTEHAGRLLAAVLSRLAAEDPR